jgi:hypothetical protein
MRSAGFLVEPQKQDQRFGPKITGTVSPSLASKLVVTVSLCLTSKPVAMVSPGLASKSVATVSLDLASKLVAMVSPGLASKSAATIL